MNFNLKPNAKSGVVPLMEKISAILMYAVVAVEVIDFAKQKYVQLQRGQYKPDEEAVEHVQ